LFVGLLFCSYHLSNTILSVYHFVRIIGVDSGRAARVRATPIIKMGVKPLFCPPNNQRRIFYFFIFYKKNMKVSRNRDTERKIQSKGSKLCMKGVNFWKKLSMTKKRYFQNFFENVVWKCIFPKLLPPNICDPNFCPPNIYDKSTPLVRIPFFPYHFVRTILPAIILSGHRYTAHVQALEVYLIFSKACDGAVQDSVFSCDDCDVARWVIERRVLTWWPWKATDDWSILTTAYPIRIWDDTLMYNWNFCT